MASGNKSVTVTSWDTLKFSWWENSQSIANNTTTIGWKLELISTSSGRIDSSASKDWSVTVNGKEYSGTNTISIGNNATKILASGTTTISHDSDGTKTFSYSFSQEFAITFSGNSIGTKSGSGSGTLTTIPRKSSLTASNGTLGKAQTLTVTKQASSFTHTITYKCGSASGTVVTKSSDTSISFTPPLSLASQAPSATNVSITFTITTYSGSTSVGSNTKTISCAIPTSVVPTVSIAVTDPTGYADTYGGYIQSMSKIKVVVTASGAYGSTIKSYSTNADGKTYTNSSFTTAVVSSKGNITIKTTVKDSRGRTATASKTISIFEYLVPIIEELNVRRVNGANEEDEQGTYILASGVVQITCLNEQNESTMLLEYRKSTEDEFTKITLESIETTIEGTLRHIKFSNRFEAVYTSSYDVRFTIDDKFKQISKTVVISSAKKFYSWLKKGLGIAFGKYAELENVFDIGFKTRHTGGILQPVLPEGSDFNDAFTPNTYTLKSANSAGYINCPITTGTGLLKVETCGEEGQTRQVVIVCSKTNPLKYERYFYQGSWGEWLTM